MITCPECKTELDYRGTTTELKLMRRIYHCPACNALRYRLSCGPFDVWDDTGSILDTHKVTLCIVLERGETTSVGVATAAEGESIEETVHKFLRDCWEWDAESIRLYTKWERYELEVFPIHPVAWGWLQHVKWPDAYSSYWDEDGPREELNKMAQTAKLRVYRACALKSISD